MRFVLLILGAIGIADTLYINSIANPNLGVFLPGILGAPLFLIGLFYTPLMHFMQQGFGRFLKLALIACYGVFFAGFAIIGSILLYHGRQVPDPGADVVVVLGAGLRDGKPSATLRSRLNRASEYLQGNEDTIVVVTGGLGSGETVTEAAASKEYLLSVGIEESRIYVEDKSTSTLENLSFAKQVLQSQAGFEEGSYKTVIVSSDFHLFRALHTAKNLNYDAQGLGNRTQLYIAPNYYLREYVAVVGYYILGRLG